MKYVYKALVVAIGTLAQLVAMNVLPDRWQSLAIGILGIAATFGVYQAPYRARTLSEAMNTYRG